mgnify:CR=1 FL=1
MAVTQRLRFGDVLPNFTAGFVLLVTVRLAIVDVAWHWLALLLALALPVELEGWWTVQSIAYGVVVFSLFLQAPLAGPLLAILHRRGQL